MKKQSGKTGETINGSVEVNERCAVLKNIGFLCLKGGDAITIKDVL